MPFPSSLPSNPREGVELVGLDDPRWSAFVHARPDALPYHHPNWAETLAETYGYPGFALCVVEDGTIVGGIPAMEARSPLGRKRWVSLPFSDTCFPLGDDLSGLAAALEDVRQAAGIGSLEVRAPVIGAPYPVRAGVRHVLALDSPADELLRTFHKSQVQRNIRVAVREGVVVRHGDSETDLTDTFFGLHVETRRRLGVPVQPRRFFSSLWRNMIGSGLGSVLVAEHDGRPIAAAVFLAWNGTTVYKFGASDQSSWKLRPNNLLFWEAIRAAAESGGKEFDFGRTDVENEGLRQFKLGWGTREEPLDYAVFANERPPAEVSRATNPFSRLITRAPAWVCRGLGELFYRYAA